MLSSPIVFGRGWAERLELISEMIYERVDVGDLLRWRGESLGQQRIWGKGGYFWVERGKLSFKWRDLGRRSGHGSKIGAKGRNGRLQRRKLLVNLMLQGGELGQGSHELSRRRRRRRNTTTASGGTGRRSGVRGRRGLPHWSAAGSTSRGCLFKRGGGSHRLGRTGR